MTPFRSTTPLLLPNLQMIEIVLRPIILSLVIFLARLCYVLYVIHKDGRCGDDKSTKKYPRKKRRNPSCTIVVLGSGGHTSEMFSLLQGISSSRYYPLIHIVASTDVTSEDRVLAAAKMASELLPRRTIKIPRSREVGQSYITSIMSTLHAFLYSFWIVARLRPNLVICNGPGTCLPVVFCTFIWRILGWCEGKVVFVESFCRVQR
jgi:beta-1,4-N-acetylglucosaminyltransferase